MKKENGALSSHFIHAITDVFSRATALPLMVVDIFGQAVSTHHSPPFCQLMRADPVSAPHCSHCDRYCGYEGLKHPEPKIMRCHAGLAIFSLPLLFDDNLSGFVIGGLAQLVDAQGVEVIMAGDERWRKQPEKRHAMSCLPVVDIQTLRATANLLRFILQNYCPSDGQQPLSTASPGDGRYQYIPRYHNVMARALEYIDRHLYDPLSLDSVAAQVYLSPHYFGRIFKKHTGVSFKHWVNQQKMRKAEELLRDNQRSIDSIARKLSYPQTRYFCQVFRGIYQISPQMFRRNQRENLR